MPNFPEGGHSELRRSLDFFSQLKNGPSKFSKNPGPLHCTSKFQPSGRGGDGPNKTLRTLSFIGMI